MEKQRYMNPITFEAEMFLNSLEFYSKMYNKIDTVLLSSLEKVMNAIEKFIDSNPTEILNTKNTELVSIGDLSHIKRMFHCTPCKQDLGKSIEKVTLHMTKNCKIGKRVVSGSKEKELQRLRDELRSVDKPKKQVKEGDRDLKLSKKTRSMLKTDLSQFIIEQPKISEKLKCLPAYNEIVNELACLIRPLFPGQNIKIYKFGSRIAGIGNRESDLDLYIDIGENFNVLHNRVDSDTLVNLHKVCYALKNNKEKWKGLVKIDKARVPILKVMHSSSGIECDINFSNSLGFINTGYLEFVFNLQPISQLLCSFMKKWLNRTRINDEINTYSINLMVLFYLQTLNVLPSMERLQENISLENALCVGPWIATYATCTLNDLQIPLEPVHKANLLKFIKGFFIFYSNFKFGKNIICPYLGKIIKKEYAEILMPRRYIEFVMKNHDYALHLDKPIVVQDPIQLNHNTTKNLTESTLRIFKSYISSSLDVLNEDEMNSNN